MSNPYSSERQTVKKSCFNSDQILTLSKDYDGCWICMIQTDSCFIKVSRKIQVRNLSATSEAHGQFELQQIQIQTKSLSVSVLRLTVFKMISA